MHWKCLEARSQVCFDIFKGTPDGVAIAGRQARGQSVICKYLFWVSASKKAGLKGI